MLLWEGKAVFLLIYSLVCSRLAWLRLSSGLKALSASERIGVGLTWLRGLVVFVARCFVVGVLIKRELWF